MKRETLDLGWAGEKEGLKAFIQMKRVCKLWGRTEPFIAEQEGLLLTTRCIWG